MGWFIRNSTSAIFPEHPRGQLYSRGKILAAKIKATINSDFNDHNTLLHEVLETN